MADTHAEPTGELVPPVLVPPSLTVDEFMALPDDTPIIVIWSGGNGPHGYTLVRDPEGRPYAAPSDDVNGRLRYYNPIHFVGQDECRTRVWLAQTGGQLQGGDR